MSRQPPTIDGRNANTALSVRECLAARILDTEWTHGEIAMCFGVGTTSISRHTNGTCSCLTEESTDEILAGIYHE